MQTTVNVVCYKSKTLSNGEHPLMIRLCQGRKLKYISLGISINAQYWDFTKNQPKRNCPNKNQILKLISDKKDIYLEQVLEFKVADKQFIVNTLAERVDKPQKAKTVRELFDVQINRLLASNRLNYSLTYKYLLSSLLKFNKHLNIHFSDIDVSWLKKYEIWLQKNDLKPNTIGIYFRTLRVLYNLAIEERIERKNIIRSIHLMLLN